MGMTTVPAAEVLGPCLAALEQIPPSGRGYEHGKPV